MVCRHLNGYRNVIDRQSRSYLSRIATPKAFRTPKILSSSENDEESSLALQEFDCRSTDGLLQRFLAPAIFERLCHSKECLVQIQESSFLFHCCL